MDDVYGIIYKVTNKVNGKRYIGQTVKSLNERMFRHIHDALGSWDNIYFHKAIRKHGVENFKWEILIECYSRNELDNIEIKLIKKYNTFGSGYNLNVGGKGNAGFKLTEDTRQKMSEAKKGKNHPNYGKHCTKETKKKIGDANRNKSRSKELRKKISESLKGENHPNYGRHLTEETKRKISESSKNKKLSEGHKRKLSESAKKRRLSSETKRKISASSKGKKSSEETKSKISKTRSKRYKITTPDGNIIFVYGLKKFCRNYKKEKLYDQNLIKVAQGKRKHHKNYKCEYYKTS